MLHTKYQRPRPCTFRQEDFKVFFLYKCMSALGQGHFWPQVYNLNNLGRRQLGEAMYQIHCIKDWDLLVSDKIFKGFLYMSM